MKDAAFRERSLMPVIVVSGGSAGWGHCRSHFLVLQIQYACIFYYFELHQHGCDGWIGVYWRKIAKEVCIVVKSDCCVIFVSVADVNVVVFGQISPGNHRNVTSNGRCC